ncbi:MAG: response regulator [SAR324 cluster bacterium]|nr:response regulator [SAR324 cluster bacterium]
MENSLRRELSLRIGFVILFVSIVIGGSYYFIFANFSEKEFKNDIENQTANISNIFTLQLWIFDLNTVKNFCSLLTNSPEIVGLRLLDHKEVVICKLDPPPQKNIIHIKKQLLYNGTTLVGYVDLYYFNTTWAQQRKNALIVGVCMVMSSLLASLLLIHLLLRRFLSKPLDNLKDDFRSNLQGEFHESKLKDQKVEIQSIVDAFNNLIRHLKFRDKEILKKTSDLKNEINERERTEGLLRISHEHWEKTFNSMEDLITVQNKDMEILQANKTTQDFFQTGNTNKIEKHCYELFLGKNSPCDGCPALETLDKGVSGSIIITHEKLGRVFHITTSPLLDERGEVTHLVHIAKDISEQKKLEEELLQSHKMEAIGTLAGGIAHDFNNILFAILGYAELLKQSISNGNPATEDVDQILNAGRRATELVHQILTFSRKGRESKKPMQPHIIIKEVLKLLRASFPASIEIQETIDPNSGTICANPTSIHQILMNLCTNSLHSMKDEKGILSIRLSRISRAHQEVIPETNVNQKDFVELVVSDNGSGIPKEFLSRVFEPYFTTKDIGKGSGMGLAMVHGIVTNLNGFIHVESTIDKGTTFFVYFPVIEKNSVELETKNNNGLPRGTERILVIDDERVNTKLYEEMLKSLGYHVTSYVSSTEALGAFQKKPEKFDLIITDQTMPHLNGGELAMKVLEIRPEIPIILCTGYSSLISEVKAQDMGIKEFIQKPVSKQTLAQTIRKILEHQPT